jgi:hypothetical protein
MENIPFNGLTMPVFTAFGWAGEETALTFALSQLEEFALELNQSLSPEAKGLMPHHGLDKISKTAYIAANSEPETGLHITFEARPMALKMTLILNDRIALQKALKSAEDNAIQWHRALIELEEEWQLRIQQMEYSPEDQTATNYKEVFKDSVNTLTPDVTREILARAAYLNGEEKWAAPIYVTRRTPAEFVAAMGRDVPRIIAAQIEQLLPLMRLLSGPGRRTRAKSRARTRAAKTKLVTTAAQEAYDDDLLERFSYDAELKPLHIRKGFINLTPAHWPFFAINSRTETRPVTVYYGDGIDKKSSVWRLVPNDLARLMLGRGAHDWIADHCDPDDKVQVLATKAPDDSIDIQLRLLNVEESE